MKKTHKRPMILFELIIALGLAAVLLTLLFRFFAGYVAMDQRLDAARKTLFQRQHLQTRLSRLFTTIEPPPSASAFSFYTLDEKETGLVTIFNNGIDPDPHFSGPVLGKIYIDEDHNLALVCWPLEKKDGNLYRKEILIPNVESMRFQFLCKKNPIIPDSNAISITPNLEWRTNWPKSIMNSPPSMIRVMIEQNQKELLFAFTLPKIEPMVTYGNGGDAG